MIRNLLAILLFGLSIFTSAIWAQEKERALTIVPNNQNTGARIALVIGNGSYQSIGALDNPVPDAELMAETLRRVGFQVTSLIDSDQRTMKRGIADFGRVLRQAGPNTTALFYYAGHAVQSFDNNYLLPVDSEIRDQADLDLVGVEADWVLRQLFTARIRTSIVILDACRNNPFEGVAGFAEQGLAEMNAPTGSFIAYATAPGRVAYDGTGSNSPYTTALSRAIETTSYPIEQLFKSVRISVLEQTGGRQTPWDSSSLTSDFFFKSPGTQSAPQRVTATTQTPAQPPAPATGLGQGSVEDQWAQAKASADAGQIKQFLRAHPDSTQANSARRLLALLSPGDTDLGSAAEQPSNDTTNTAPAAINGDIYFDRPLLTGGQLFAGQTIPQLTKGQPRFPPFDGVPENMWKGQQCTNCHQWSRELLCEQGQFYLSSEATRSLAKQHPYGGGFKQILKVWADGGCQ